MVIVLPARRHLRVAIALLVLSGWDSARADDPPPLEQPAASAPSGQKSGMAGRRAAETPNTPATAEPHRLPPDSTTQQTLDLPGRSLAFTATAGSIRLFDEKGEPQADIAYTSYQLDGAERATRPVTFLFNGGPGAASAYLQLGHSPPRRPARHPLPPSPSSALQPRPQTSHDYT